MKRTIAIIAIAVVLLAVLVQAGYAATLGGGHTLERRQGGPGTCQGLCYCADLSPEEQEQVRAARKECREKMEGLREDFRSRQQSLREECLEKLPEALREQVQERAAARDGQGCGGGMQGRHGCGRGPGMRE